MTYVLYSRRLLQFVGKGVVEAEESQARTVPWYGFRYSCIHACGPWRVTDARWPGHTVSRGSRVRDRALARVGACQRRSRVPRLFASSI